jgi:hypothetical protein
MNGVYASMKSVYASMKSVYASMNSVYASMDGVYASIYGPVLPSRVRLSPKLPQLLNHAHELLALGRGVRVHCAKGGRCKGATM